MEEHVEELAESWELVNLQLVMCENHALVYQSQIKEVTRES